MDSGAWPGFTPGGGLARKIFTSMQYHLVVQSLMNTTCGSQVNFFEFDYRRMEVDCKLEYHIYKLLCGLYR